MPQTVTPALVKREGARARARARVRARANARVKFYSIRVKNATTRVVWVVEKVSPYLLLPVYARSDGRCTHLFRSQN